MSRETSRWAWLEQFAQDLRYAWRGLRQSPAFLAMTVLTLAVGLGLVTGQVAVSLVLVIVAMTLARNGAAIGAIDPGFETKGVISVNVRDEAEGLVERLAAVLASDPRVAEVAVTGGNPLFVRSRAIAAAPAQAAVAGGTRYTFVSPEYFSIPESRSCAAADFDQTKLSQPRAWRSSAPPRRGPSGRARIRSARTSGSSGPTAGRLTSSRDART